MSKRWPVRQIPSPCLSHGDVKARTPGCPWCRIAELERQLQQARGYADVLAFSLAEALANASRHSDFSAGPGRSA